MARRAVRFLKLLLWNVFPRVYERFSATPKTQFSIGIYAGASPFEMRPAAGAANPVLSRQHITEVPAGTVADPFMIRVRGLWYMFFELTNRIRHKGEIALATSEDALKWTFEQIVLAEPFHMSYPYVFEWGGDIFMIPETGRSRSVRLYQADQFPTAWRHVATLLEGARFSDSSVFRYDDLWWLYVDAGANARAPLLRLYFASELTGPWTEHPQSPLAGGDPHISRPGGRVVVIDNTPYRFTQNVYPVYGTEVRAFEVCELSKTSYREKQVGRDPVIAAGEEPWNRHGMHHIDPHLLPDGTWLACVDGCIRQKIDNQNSRSQS